jgi:hypothetical protein
MNEEVFKICQMMVERNGTHLQKMCMYSMFKMGHGVSTEVHHEGMHQKKASKTLYGA